LQDSAREMCVGDALGSIARSSAGSVSSCRSSKRSAGSRIAERGAVVRQPRRDLVVHSIVGQTDVRHVLGSAAFT
jgi:hypothetical protein